jgi:oligosaccharyltransferase complex subunit gamma
MMVVDETTDRDPARFARVLWPRIALSFATTMLIFLPFLSLLALPAIVLAAQDSPRQQLVKLAAKNNGVINLDAETFELLTSPERDWSASIHFTALDKRRKCGPCK